MLLCVFECLVYMEVVVVVIYGIGDDMFDLCGCICVFELCIQCVYVYFDLLMDGYLDCIDLDKWLLLIMSFQKFYGLVLWQVYLLWFVEIFECVYCSFDIECLCDVGMLVGSVW